MPVEMVVVGHVGLSTVQTGDKEQTSPGGSGYAVAACAAALIGHRVGLVAQVGDDFDLGPLRQLGLDLGGVATLPGPSARLRIDQFDDGTRAFRADLGVAADVRVEGFPPAYRDARHIHLGTAPPEQQLTWLRFLREQGCTAQISADMFERYVADYPDKSRAICDKADLVFMNQAEHEGLYGDGRSRAPRVPLVLKRGGDGASLITAGRTRKVGAPPVVVVDPTGGGEILAGVYLALRTDGLEELRALRYAARAAASCVEDFGVHGGRLVATLADIRAELRLTTATGAARARARSVPPRPA